MEISVRAMLAVAGIFAVVLGILGAWVWRTRRTYAGCRRMTIANLLYALCLLLYASRPVVPDWIGVVGANAVLAAAAILSLEATREYRGLRPRFFLAYAGGVLAILVLAYFDYVRNINARIVVMSTFMGVVFILCSVTLLRERHGGRKLGVAVCGGMFAMSGALLLARAGYFFLAPPLADFFAPSWVNGAFFVACTLSIACCSIGWDVMISERALTELNEVESRIVRATREAAEATERANSMAQRAATADATRREFLETVNHEIRNPVGGLVAATDLLLDSDLTPEQRECAAAVLTGAERLLKVNDELLVLCEIEAGRTVSESCVFDLRDVIDKAASAYSHLATGKRIDLKVTYPAAIPHRFHGDTAKIRQVMMELVGNAVRSTSSGQVLVAVACGALDTQHAQMRVSLIYGSSFHGDACIELMVSKKVLELMGVQLHVENQVDEGSKFWFELPLAVEDASQ